jgi:hypothetical protein
MTLKTATKIQKAADITLWVVMLPFGICGIAIEKLTKPFEWVVGWFDNARFRIGNRLLNISDEAKDGTIKNDYCLRNFTALDAYKKLEEEKNNN